MNACWVVEWKFRNLRGAKWTPSLWMEDSHKREALDYIADRARENPEIEYRLRQDKPEKEVVNGRTR